MNTILLIAAFMVNGGTVSTTTIMESVEQCEAAKKALYNFSQPSGWTTVGVSKPIKAECINLNSGSK